MSKSVKEMTYKEFKEWCNDRACDGQWGTMEAMTYIAIIEQIDKIKVKGFFKKKQQCKLEKQNGEIHFYKENIL